MKPLKLLFYDQGISGRVTINQVTTVEQSIPATIETEYNNDMSAISVENILARGEQAGVIEAVDGILRTFEFHKKT